MSSIDQGHLRAAAFAEGLLSLKGFVFGGALFVVEGNPLTNIYTVHNVYCMYNFQCKNYESGGAIIQNYKKVLEIAVSQKGHLRT